MFQLINLPPNLTFHITAINISKLSRVSLNNYIPGEARGDGAQYLCVGTIVSINSQYHVSQSLPLEISKSIESLFLHLEVSPNVQSPRHPN